MLIISGGQTGVDRAALDAAIDLGIAHGGWCPKGRRAEDGVIPSEYKLWEHPSNLYPPRTRANVNRADATVILHYGKLGRGTKLTLDYVVKSGKPHFISVMEANITELVKSLHEFLERNGPVVNFAGPRESTNPGIHDSAYLVIKMALKRGGL